MSSVVRHTPTKISLQNLFSLLSHPTCSKIRMCTPNVGVCEIKPTTIEN